MRWSYAFAACAVATVASAQPLSPRDSVVLLDEHHAIERELALGRLAEHGSPAVRELGEHLVRDLGFGDEQVTALARIHHADLFSAPDTWDRMNDERMQRIARLDGTAFDRAVLAAIADELRTDLAWIDSLAPMPQYGDVTTLLATMRPTLLRFQTQAAYLERRLTPAS